MDISIFLAKFWGWYLLIFFFVLSFNPRRIRQIFEDLRDQNFVILVASIAQSRKISFTNGPVDHMQCIAFLNDRGV